MSLTSILNYNNKRFTEFRALLEEMFPIPKSVGELPIKVEPRTKNFGLVGTAFDYLLRFSIEKKYKTLIHSRPWVSESALKQFKNGGFTYFGNPDDLDFDNIETLMEKQKADNKKVIDKFENGKKIYNEFISTQVDIPDDLIEYCLFLSRLDLIYRSSIENKVSLEPEDPQDLFDLKLLIQNCNLDLFCPKEIIILNPTFGKGSELVKGADADLIVDNTLIDIKTIKDQRLTRPIYNQIICYYLLYLFGGIDGHKDLKIQNIGIYFSRHNYLWTIPITNLGNDKDFQKALIKLKSQIKNK